MEPNPAITVPEVVKAYLQNLEARIARGTYSVESYGNVKRNLERFAKCFPVPVNNCRRSDLERFVDSMPDSYRSYHARKGCFMAIIVCFKWAALEEELIDRCPYRMPKDVCRTAYPARAPMKMDNFRAIIRKAQPEMRRALIALYRTGMRTCELTRLQWDDVHLDVPAPYFDVSAKLRRRRIVLDAVLIKMVLWLLRHRPASQKHVFLSTNKKPWQGRNLFQHFSRARKRAGVPMSGNTIYLIRHRYAVDGVTSGLSNKAVADLLGHVDSSMVDRVYAASTRDDMGHLVNCSTKIIEDRAKRPAPTKVNRPCPIATDPRNAVTLADLIDKYLPHLDELCAEGVLGYPSRDNTRAVLRRAKEKLGALTVAEVKNRTVHEFIMGEPVWASAWSQRTARLFVIRVFKWAESQGLCGPTHFSR